MGFSGPPPNPNARRQNKREINGRLGTARPRMPSGMPAEAQNEWRRVVAELADTGLLTKLDRAALVRYCEAWAAWVEVDAQIKRTGNLVRDRNGELRRNPLTFIRREHADTLDKLGAQLMLTPQARLRGGIAHDEPSSGDDAPGVTSMARWREKVAEA